MVTRDAPPSRDPHGLAALHARIDVLAAEVAEKHLGRLHCTAGCSACCIDDLTVLEVEADRIRAAHPELLATGAPAPAGRCAFLDRAGSCRAYEVRPYVCRTQGLPLRWLEEAEDESIVEARDICPLNLVGPPLAELDAAACFQLGPAELELLALDQARAPTADEPRRVPLRALFGDRAPW